VVAFEQVRLNFFTLFAKKFATTGAEFCFVNQNSLNVKKRKVNDIQWYDK
jgi:hypothetical protein